MAQAVRRRRVIAVTSVQSQVSPHEICGGQSGDVKDLSQYFVFMRTNGRCLGTLKKSNDVCKIGEKWIEHTSP